MEENDNAFNTNKKENCLANKNLTFEFSRDEKISSLFQHVKSGTDVNNPKNANLASKYVFQRKNDIVS